MKTGGLLRRSFSPEECAVTEATGADVIDGVLPSCVVAPSTEVVVAEVIRLAAREKLAVLTVGNRQHLHIGNPATHIDVLLSTARLNHMVHYEAADLTASAGTGATLGQLAALTIPHRQFLPLDPPGQEAATLGGTISANLFGSLRTSYGTARDYVVGARFVRGDGTAVKSGGRVVKNVAGFDLHKLLVGAHGTLGVVTEISLKLRPMPESELTVLTCVDQDGLRRMLRELNYSPLLPMRVAALNREAARAVLPEFASRGYALLASFGDTAASNRLQSKKLRALCEASGASVTDLLPDEIATTAWNRLREIDPSLDAGLTLRVNVLPSKSAETIGLLNDRLASVASHHSLVAMPLVGVIWLSVRQAMQSESDVARWSRIIASLREAMRAQSGSVILERAPVALKRAVNVWGEAVDTAFLMKRIRMAFDPSGVFVPERFLK